MRMLEQFGDVSKFGEVIINLNARAIGDGRYLSPNLILGIAEEIVKMRPLVLPSKPLLKVWGTITSYQILKTCFHWNSQSSPTPVSIANY